MYKRQYNIYKAELYQDDRKIINNEKELSKGCSQSEQDISTAASTTTASTSIFKLNLEEENLDSVKKPYESYQKMAHWLYEKIRKYSGDQYQANEIAREYCDKLQQLRDALTDNNIEKIYYRYHLAKYIYERKMQDSSEWKIHSFFRGVVGFDIDAKVSAAVKIEAALAQGEKIVLDHDAYLASQEGNLGDINKKFVQLYDESIGCSSKDENKVVFNLDSHPFWLFCRKTSYMIHFPEIFNHTKVIKVYQYFHVFVQESHQTMVACQNIWKIF